MKAIIYVTNQADKTDDDAWQESYDKPEIKDQSSAEAFGRDVVDYWNSTLRRGEKARRYVRAEFIGGDEVLETVDHEWDKVNLMTIPSRGRVPMHDKYRCEVCGITAKRSGVEWPPTRDSKFAAEKYKSCSG